MFGKIGPGLSMPGLLEIIVVLVIGCLVIGVPVAIVVLLVMFLRKESSGDESSAYSELMKENLRLQDEIAALKNKTD